MKNNNTLGSASALNLQPLEFVTQRGRWVEQRNLSLINQKAFMKYSLLLSFVLLFSFIANAGEPKDIHLTGNPQVDFFSARELNTFQSSTPSAFQSDETITSSGKKSPWLAGAMSLLVPGAGEVYAGNYLKGAIFFGIEVGTLVTAYLYDKKGDDQTVLFESYANQHWSAVRYAEWIEQNIGNLHPTASWNPNVYNSNYDPNDPNRHAPPFGDINWETLQSIEREVAEGVTNGFTHTLPYYGQQQYYELIGKYVQFYAGWDDAESGTYAIGTTKPSDFHPADESRFRIYSKMRAQANDYYDITTSMISIAVINHVLSALDAAWTATRYNNALEARVNLKMQPTPFGNVPVKELHLSYTF
ncbi:MAG: hypothetical protein HYZ34_13910 [Ignavibacteriae bacterium]|nr:hypothetical protein [Ignavibacteriota bacterium]